MTIGPLDFTVERNANPASDEVRGEILSDPGFGRFHTDHMVSVLYTHELGWHQAEVLPYGPIELDPSAIVLHYAPREHRDRDLDNLMGYGLKACADGYRDCTGAVDTQDHYLPSRPVIHLATGEPGRLWLVVTDIGEPS